ncbi:hypothetical protein [Devosia sp.]|uniref:hypothetical protein n=1 Tax=Devosia sp. TaxID=1871048 RepID=UPI003266C8A7
MSIIRFSIVVALVAISGFFITIAVAQHAGQLMLLAFDRFDDRPARDILLIGNSRTYLNDMPYMILAMADSARSPDKLEIKVLATDGASLEQQWSDTTVQQALAKTWQTVVLQPESRAQSGETERASFFQFAKQFAAHIQAEHTAFMVNWAYDTPAYPDGADGRARHVALIENDYRTMATQTGADLTYVSRAWDLVRAEQPGFSLYLDGNHPTIYGSYLAALMIYAYLSDSDGSAVSYIPAPMSAPDAARIKAGVAQALRRQ